MSQRYVLFLFGDNEIGYSAAASLEGTGYHPVYFRPYSGANPFKTSNKFMIKGQSQYSWRDGRFLEELLDFVVALKSETPVLTFLTSDDAVYFWISHQQALEEKCTVLSRTLDRFYNKWSFYKSLQDIGVPFPKTWSLDSSGQEATGSLPFLLKPAIPQFADALSWRTGVRVVKNKWDLARAKKLNPQEFLCQEIIKFQTSDEYSWWGYRNLNGDVTSLVVQHRGKFPSSYGQTTCLELIQHQMIKPMGDSIVQQLRYAGLAEIRMVFERTTPSLKVTDFNGRLWGGHQLAALNGANLIRKCAVDYYDPNSRAPGGPLELESGDKTFWYSILDNRLQFNLFNIRCMEFYKSDSDNFLTRLSLKLSLAVKLVCSFLLGRVISHSSRTSGPSGKA